MEGNAMGTKGGRYSLKWGLVLLVVACWIVPITIFSGATGYFITQNINDQIARTINLSANNSVKMAVSQIDFAANSSRYASYNPSVKNAYANYQKNRDSTALYESVTGFLNQQYKYDEKFLITTLYFCDNSDNIYYTYNEEYNATYFKVKEYRENVHNKVQQLSQTLGTGIGFLNVDGQVYMVRNILGSDYKTIAVITMQLNTDTMFAGIENVVWETDITIWLDDTPVVLDGSSLDPEKLGISFAREDQTLENIGGSSYVSGMSEADSCKLKYVIGVDSSPLMQEFSGVTTKLIWIAVMIIPLLGAVILFFTRSVSRPIDRLIVDAKSIEKGNFGVQIEDRFSSSEFQYLADAFNSMSYKLKYQFDRIYKEELALRDAKIMALQSQINPHFLNNTLEIINWEARLSKNTKVSKMIEALSTMLDAAMDRKGKPIVHISEEMMYVDAYLYIITERLGKRLTVKKEIDNTLLDLYVPRLIMQPIIENAVEHDIQSRTRGEIIIRIYRQADDLILEVEHDGVLTDQDSHRIEHLLSDETLIDQEAANSLGIRNVNQRLKIIYGEKSGLSIKMNKTNRILTRIVIVIEQEKQ